MTPRSRYCSRDTANAMRRQALPPVHGEFVNSRTNGGQNQKRSRRRSIIYGRNSGAGARFNDTRVGGRAGQGGR